MDYSPADRAEHLRRVAHIAKLLNDQGIIVICSFISPKESIRQQIKEIIGENRFKLIYMDAVVEFCNRNDKYGLYKLADDGKINHLAGIDEDYETPTTAIVVDVENVEKVVEKIIEKIKI